MRIQRQRDTFAYRLAAPAAALPKSFQYTDEDWAQHTADVERILAARLLKQSKGGGLPDGELPRDSYYLNGSPVIDKRGGKRKVSWVLSPERKALHDQIINHFMPDIDRVPKEKKAILLGGLGGSGKGSILRDMRTGVRLDDNDNPIDYFTINPDTVKEYMASIGAIPKVNGLSPMEASPLTHEEASDIAKELAKRAYEKGANVIWDYTMSSDQSGLDRIKDMKERGYNDFSGIFVDVDGETARQRAMHRWKTGQESGNPIGGRALASWTSKDNEAPEGSPFRSKNAEAFDKLAKMGVFNSGYIKYDNTDDPAYQVAGGRPGQAVPRVMEAAGKWAPIGLGAEKPNSRVMAANIRLAKMVQAYIDQGVDPASVRGLLRAFRQQQIDIHQLTEAIVSRLAMLEADEDDADESNYFNRAEEMADDDSLWWINSARHRGTLTHQEEDYLFSEIAKADHP